MGTVVDKTEGNVAYTENGALTNASTTNKVLDLFFAAGSCRTRPDSDIVEMVDAAATQDLGLTLKLVFWARDVLKGAGERRFFRLALARLVEKYPDELALIVPVVPDFGRWDDMLVFMNTPLEQRAIAVMADAFNAGNALMVKWLPQRGPVVNKLAKVLGFSGNPKGFRQKRVAINRVVETAMSEKRFGDINYSQVPGQAMKKYRKAFARQDKERFSEYVAALVKGDKTVKINAKAVYPYQILHAIRHAGSKDEINLLDQQWRALPDFMAGSTKRAFVMLDTSGSMESLFNAKYGSTQISPLTVGVSLAIYMAERNHGPFKDAFLTFSTKPQLAQLRGANLKEKSDNLDRKNWDMSTDLNAAFKFMLEKAVEFKVPESEMPTMLLVLSDMEFNAATSGAETPFDEIRRDYAAAGYALPVLVYWNLAARNKDNHPVIDITPNTALISGFSPSILQPLLKSDVPRPDMFMREVLESDRYAPVVLNK